MLATPIIGPPPMVELEDPVLPVDPKMLPEDEDEDEKGELELAPEKGLELPEVLPVEDELPEPIGLAESPPPEPGVVVARVPVAAG